MLKKLLQGALVVALSAIFCAPARATDANTCGFVQGNGGWYRITDRSGPYSLDGNCNAVLIGSGGASYPLASNVGVAGTTAPQTNVVGNSYIYACDAGTWNSATAQLQTLGPDGVTWVNVGTALSANGTLGVVIGISASVRVNVTGTPTGLYCNLS